MYCCDDLKFEITRSCELHENPYDCPDVIVLRIGYGDTVGMPIHDGGRSWIQITYCPWCGEKFEGKLPPSDNLSQ